MKILLLTPYTGGNLGDAAIQEGVIANIRKRVPDTEIVLVTLSPNDTTRLHGVRSFPIAITTFGPGFPTDEDTAAPSRQIGEAGRKRPITLTRVVNALRARAGRRVRRLLYWSGLLELGHIVRAYLEVRGARMLIVSGGGQLDDYWGGPLRQPYALLKWSLLARAAGVRVVFLSIGTCTLRPSSKHLVTAALHLADYRSFRDVGSKQLAAFARCTLNDPIVPDLAFSYDPPVTDSDISRRPERLVGISPIAYLSRIWPESDSAIYKRYLEALAALVVELVGQGWRVALFTSDAVDWSAILDLQSLLRERGRAAMAGRVEVRRTFALADFFDEVRRCDLFVASRLHGVVLANLAAVPTLAISYDRKVDAYMHDTGLDAHCVDIHRLTQQTLVSGFHALYEDADRTRATLARQRAERRQQLDRQYDAVLGRLRPLYELDPRGSGI
jgi:polysaccharide pyruvyl transferase WcaK-like protein